MTDSAHKHWLPKAPRDRRPSPTWYFGWAAYVNRYGYLRVFWKVLALAIVLFLLGLFFSKTIFFTLLIGLGVLSVGVLSYSLMGINRMYGSPASAYMSRLLQAGETDADAVIADLHIGTWRHSYLLAELLPTATIHSVDCWDYAGTPAEANVVQLHELESEPLNPPFQVAQATDYTIPLADHSCDAVVAGFGLHEIPLNGPLEKLMDEAKRILKPGGKMLLFEHLVDSENFVIFGPGIDHWPRRSNWLAMLKLRFDDVVHIRAPQAVDLFVGKRL